MFNLFIPMDELIFFEQYKGESELERMLELIEADLSEPYSIYTYRFFLHNWPNLCFNCKLKETNQIIGTVVGKLQEHKKGSLRGYIGMLAVDPVHRGNGIGTQLVRFLVEEMQKKFAQEIVLETEITNANALKLYEKLGFFRDKYLLRYYFNGSDAYRLKYYFGNVQK